MEQNKGYARSKPPENCPRLCFPTLRTSTKRASKRTRMGDYTYRNMIARVIYEDCRKIDIKRNRLAIEYKNGKKEQFTIHGYGGRNKIKAFFGTVVPGEGQDINCRRVHLCPVCTKELIPDCMSVRIAILNSKTNRKGKGSPCFIRAAGSFIQDILFWEFWMPLRRHTSQ